MNVRDLSAVDRTATWLIELIAACRRPGQLYGTNPELVADVTRKAKALQTVLDKLRHSLKTPKEPPHDHP